MRTTPSRHSRRQFLRRSAGVAAALSVGAPAIVTRGWGLLELRPMRMSLEDVFLQLTTQDAAEESAPLAETAHE